MRARQSIGDRAGMVVCGLKKRVLKGMYAGLGRRPWSRGYQQSKFDLIDKVLRDEALISRFSSGAHLPEGFGCGFDERVVEYPWMMARLSTAKGRLLDGGSVLNFEELVKDPRISSKQVTIFTLAPEYQAFWQRGISYQYGDLRSLPFRDGWFDEVCSISTLGHVGMDNRLYKPQDAPPAVGLEAEEAIGELIRVLKPGGIFLASVVYGKHQFIEWDGTSFAEQFDSLLLADLLKSFRHCASVKKTFYRYSSKGWDIASQQECDGLEYFNIHTDRKPAPDGAAAARAVALIEVVK